MKPLEKNFIGGGDVRGFEFTQIEQSSKAFIYQITPPESNPHYEVFECKIQQETDIKMMGVTVHLECKERYPDTNAFGVWAWCISNKEKAYSKYSELTNKN
jgi:hypothetical protein